MCGKETSSIVDARQVTVERVAEFYDGSGNGVSRLLRGSIFGKFAEKPANLKLTPKMLKGGFQVTSREGRSIYQE